MAHSLSAKQRIRRNGRRADVNGARRSRIRTFERNVDEAIASGDKEAAQAALKSAQPELQRAVSKGVLHQNTVSRKISRISARIKAM